ncbi:hypothetical protein CCR97_12190 [Rhodoplanes elegans]|uniref:Uncharacterized protein n=1 Tax=Rhodoplanes elegans TaxID=29408 RepID=A0A327KEZ8_9BRAD|nr:hypothetical protein [Rhodoplanes elegans]RAI36691.1 hypothetical protein CH338_17225 [Rhodoplanes elegans]
MARPPTMSSETILRMIDLFASKVAGLIEEAPFGVKDVTPQIRASYDDFECAPRRRLRAVSLRRS